MFTGIIEKTGVVSSLEGKKLTLQARFHKISLGESVAVNGCCLTVVSKKEGRLVLDLSDTLHICRAQRFHTERKTTDIHAAVVQ